MRKFFLICGLVGLASCSGQKSHPEKDGANDAGYPVAAVSAIQGQWDIVNVVENDSAYVRPSEIEQGMTAYIDFRDDDSFGVMTNCNHIGGRYHLDGDSMRLTDISTTEMACDDMELEEMLKKILPMVNAIDCINDSITRLNSGKGDSYIVLKKRDLAQK